MPRQQERIPFRLEVVLESASGKREVRISDLSAGGCYVDTIVGAQEGEPVNLQFKMPSTGEIMAFSCEAAYVFEGMGFGVRFTSLTEQHKDFLDKLMKSSG